MGNAGSSYGAFQTALRTGSFQLACDVARDLPRISLSDALRLTLLAARKKPELYPGMARRWLARLLVEREPSLDSLAWAAALLSINAEAECNDDQVAAALRGLL